MEAAPHTPNPDQSPISRFTGVPTEELEKQLASLERRERRLESVADRAEVWLGSIVTADGFRAGRVHDAAAVVSQRRSTDPFAPVEPTHGVYHLPEVEGPMTPSDPFKPEGNYRRSPDTTLGKLTLKPAIGHFAAKYSVHGPRGDEIQDQAEARPDGSPNSIPGRVSETLNARRVRRQELRQSRAKRAERLSGAMIGVGGKEAFIGTKIHRFRRNQEARHQMWRGEISSREFVDQKLANKASRVEIPARAVRREVRRERVGAMYTLKRAGHPLRKRVQKVKQGVAQKTLDKANIKLARIQSRQASIDEELARRLHDHVDPLDEDDKD